MRSEVVVPGPVEHVGRELGLAAVVGGEVDDLVHQVARVAGEQRPLVAPVVVAHQQVEGLVGVGDAALCADLLQDLAVLAERQLPDEDLVADAAQEGVVGHVGGREVGREHQHHVEGDLELAAVAQHQVVVATVHRHDPAVHQLARRDHLAAQVVDQEEAVVGLEVRRSLVVAGARVVHQVEHVERELAAGDHDWAAAQHPAPVVRARLSSERSGAASSCAGSCTSGS